MYNFLKKFPFPLVVAISYIFIGVLGHKWHPTWMMFLLIPAYYGLVFSLGKKQEGASTKKILKNFPFPTLVVVIYLFLGFFLNMWHPGWLVFLLIPLYYSIIPLFSGDDDKDND